MKQTVFIFLFVAVVIFIGLLIRVQGIFNNNILFLFDSARDLLYVKKIVVDHDLILIGPSSGGLQGYFHGVLWYYILTIPFLLGKGNPAAFTLFMAICSTLSTVLAFFLMNKIIGLKGALVATLFYSFAVFSVATSRFIWNPYPIVWLMPVYIFALFSFAYNKPFALPLAALVTGLIIHFEIIYGICLIPVLLLMLILSYKRKDTLRQKIVILSAAFVLFSLSFVPSIIFDMKHQFLITSSIYKTVTTKGANISHKEGEKPKKIQERLYLRSNDLYAYTVQSVTQNRLVNGMLFLIFIAGVIQILRERSSELRLFLILCFVALVSPFFVFINLKYAVWSYYWIGNSPLYVLLLAFVMGYVLNKNKKVLLLFYSMIIGLFLLYIPSLKIEKWYKGDLTPGTQVLSTQLEVVKKVYEDIGEENFSVYVLTPPVYDYVYRYLFWSQGQQNSNFPRDEKQKIVYVIIESNPSDPTGAYFKKNVVKTMSAPEKTFKFPEIIIEKIITSPHEEQFDINFLSPL